MTPIAAYAKGGDSTWHMLGDAVVEVDAPALCGRRGPWTAVTGLSPQGGRRCEECDRAAAKARG